jgi:hypothetical protein
MSEINLARLSDPFPAEDIEWRVSRAGMGKGGTFCMVLAYITARAIQSRLDEVCGPENWKNEPLTIHEVRPGVVAMQVGISIRIGDEWVTKWDVSEPTADRGSVSAPAKGGFSSATKRAGCQWGIGRYLYHLDETFAETSETGGKGWNYAQLPEKHGGGTYYWKPPALPSWALPKEPEHEIKLDELNALKRAWKEKFAPDSTNPADMRDGFSRFVVGIVGDFPAADFTCWSRGALERCQKQIQETTDPEGPAADVPFDK